MFHVSAEYFDVEVAELIHEVIEWTEVVENVTDDKEVKASTVIVDLSKQDSLNCVELAAGFPGQAHLQMQLSHHYQH